MTFNLCFRNIRDRYENEIKEIENGERVARNRYLEMKSILTQKEEEIVYLRARLHTQDLELCELQHVSIRISFPRSLLDKVKTIWFILTLEIYKFNLSKPSFNNFTRKHRLSISYISSNQVFN